MVISIEKLKTVYNREDDTHNEKNAKFAQKLIELRRRQIKEKEKINGENLLTV